MSWQTMPAYGNSSGSPQMPDAAKLLLSGVTSLENLLNRPEEPEEYIGPHHSSQLPQPAPPLRFDSLGALRDMRLEGLERGPGYPYHGSAGRPPDISNILSGVSPDRIRDVTLEDLLKGLPMPARPDTYDIGGTEWEFGPKDAPRQALVRKSQQLDEAGDVGDYLGDDFFGQAEAERDRFPVGQPGLGFASSDDLDLAKALGVDHLGLAQALGLIGRLPPDLGQLAGFSGMPDIPSARKEEEAFRGDVRESWEGDTLQGKMAERKGRTEESLRDEIITGMLLQTKLGQDSLARVRDPSAWKRDPLRPGPWADQWEWDALKDSELPFGPYEALEEEGLMPATTKGGRLAQEHFRKRHPTPAHFADPY